MAEGALNARKIGLAERSIDPNAVWQAGEGDFAELLRASRPKLSGESSAWLRTRTPSSKTYMTFASCAPSLGHEWIDTNEPHPLITSESQEIRSDWRLLVNIASGIFKHAQAATDTKLTDAIQDLREVRDEAREEGFPEPSAIALANAERLLKAMYVISPQRFEVYPTPDAEVAIDAPSGHGESVLLLCESSGGALCLVDLNGEHRRARYGSTRTLPDGFIAEALTELMHAASQPR